MTTTSLVDFSSVIRDPRQESKIDHELIDILVLCVFGIICGAEGWQDIEEVGHARLSWLIENQLHWVLDVSFREDESRVRRNNAPENIAVFRHVVMNALRREKTCKKGVKAKRFKATLQAEYAQKVLDGIF